MALFKKQPEPTPEQTPEALRKKVQALEKKLEETNTHLQELEERSRRSITKVGVVRFNPFQEIGGDQSFCIALLDEQNNGAVIMSYYGRELNRVYAKRIEHGTSNYELSKEEKEAINQAMDQIK